MNKSNKWKENTIFCASDYDNNYCKLYGDACISISKIVKDRTFGEMRRDLYLDGEEYIDTIDYRNNRIKLKNINKELHDLFYNKKKVCFTYLLNKYIYGVKWKQFPKNLKFDVSNCKIFGFYDGNEQCILAEDDKYFYYALHTTS